MRPSWSAISGPRGAIGVNSAGVETHRVRKRISSADRAFLVCSLAITLLSCAINLPGLTNAEVIDDHDLLHSRSGRGCGRNPIGCFRHPLFGLYHRPLTGASFSVGENLHGQSPLPFHVENLALHFVVMLEACWAFRLILRRDRTAMLAALLYGVHPLQVTVTTFIGGRTDSLAMFFAFWFVIGAIRSRSAQWPWPWRALSIAGFAGAIFCKEQCIPLVLLLPILALPDRRARICGRGYLSALRPWMAWYPVSIALLLESARRVIPPGAIDTVVWKATKTQVSWDLGLRIEMVGRTIWYYMRCFFGPTVPVLHQSTVGLWDFPQPLTALGGFFAAGLALALLLGTWPNRTARTFALWFALTMAPCLNIITIPSQFVGCYRAVIPLFGIAGLAALLCDGMVDWLLQRKGPFVAWSVPAVIAAALAVMSSADVPVWRSDAAVTLAEFQGDTNFLPALAGYAISIRKVGRTREAVAVNDRVVSRLFPHEHSWQERVAAIDAPWMLRHVKTQSSLRYQPRGFIDYVMRERGGGLQDLGQFKAAIEDYRVALAAVPSDLQVADALVYCCEVSGLYEDEREALEALVKYAPSSARFHRLGATYVHLARWQDAKDVLARSLALAVREKSSNVEAILRMYNSTEAHAERESRSHAGQ